jgi:hypothetical protein
LNELRAHIDASYPASAALIFRAQDHVYGSAIDYTGEKGLVDVFVSG